MRALVSIRQLSEIIGVSVHAIRYHIRMGRITPIRIGRRMVFDADDVIQSLKMDSAAKRTGTTPARHVSGEPSVFENQLVERALGISEKEKA